MELMFLVIGMSLLMLLALVSPGAESLRRPMPLMIGHQVSRRRRRRRQSQSSRSRLAPRLTRA
jgi:hypothetical protein